MVWSRQDMEFLTWLFSHPVACAFCNEGESSNHFLFTKHNISRFSSTGVVSSLKSTFPFLRISARARPVSWRWIYRFSFYRWAAVWAPSSSQFTALPTAGSQDRPFWASAWIPDTSASVGQCRASYSTLKISENSLHLMKMWLYPLLSPLNCVYVFNKCLQTWHLGWECRLVPCSHPSFTLSWWEASSSTEVWPQGWWGRWGN